MSPLITYRVCLKRPTIRVFSDTTLLPHGMEYNNELTNWPFIPYRRDKKKKKKKKLRVYAFSCFHGAQWNTKTNTEYHIEAFSMLVNVFFLFGFAFDSMLKRGKETNKPKLQRNKKNNDYSAHQKNIAQHSPWTEQQWYKNDNNPIDKVILLWNYVKL